MSRELELTHIEICPYCKRKHILREGEGLATCGCEMEEKEMGQ